MPGTFGSSVITQSRSLVVAIGAFGRRWAQQLLERDVGHTHPRWQRVDRWLPIPHLQQGGQARWPVGSMRVQVVDEAHVLVECYEKGAITLGDGFHGLLTSHDHTRR